MSRVYRTEILGGCGGEDKIETGLGQIVRVPGSHAHSLFFIPEEQKVFEQCSDLADSKLWKYMQGTWVWV